MGAGKGRRRRGGRGGRAIAPSITSISGPISRPVCRGRVEDKRREGQKNAAERLQCGGRTGLNRELGKGKN